MKRLALLLLITACSDTPAGVSWQKANETCKPADQAAEFRIASTGKAFRVRGYVCFEPIETWPLPEVSGDYAITIHIPKVELLSW